MYVCIRINYIIKKIIIITHWQQRSSLKKRITSTLYVHRWRNSNNNNNNDNDNNKYNIITQSHLQIEIERERERERYLNNSKINVQKAFIKERKKKTKKRIIKSKPNCSDIKSNNFNEIF